MIDYPMSPEQESIWLNDQFEEGVSRYIESWTYSLRGAIDPAALSAALDQLVARHEPLRSALQLVGGRPRQVVHPAAPVPFTRLRIRRDELDAALAKAVSAPIPLSQAPLLRATLLELSEHEMFLAVAIHHAAVDGWSFRLLDEELGELYRANVAGRPPALPPLPLRFGEHAARPRDADAETSAAAYWRDALSGAPAESSFPAEHPRPAVLGPRGAQVELTIDPDRLAKVRALCRSAKVTPFAVFAATLSLLLSRLSGSRDVVIGTPISRRDSGELQGLIACLTEVMPLRQHIDPSADFTALVAGTRRTVRAALAHKNLPVSRLLREVAAPRSRSRFPLFQVVLTVDDADSDGLRLPGIVTERHYVHSGTSKFDVFLNLVQHDGAVRGLLEYSTDLFSAAAATRLAERFVALLARVTDDPTCRLGDVDALSGGERELALEWSKGPPCPRATSVRTTVETSARRRPKAIAVIHGDRHVDYAQLLGDARRIAESLVAAGHSGSRVAICIDRSIELVVAVLGTLLAGCCCVPLDAAYPQDRLAFMLRDSGASVLLTGSDRPDRFAGTADVWRMDNLPVPNAPVALPDVTPDDLAYVIYTSGSTGVPKGVAVPHRTLEHLMAWQSKRSPGGTTLQFAPLSFDVSFQELVSTWASGDALIVVDETSRRDPQRLLDLCNRHGVNRVFLPYVALQQLAEFAAADGLTCPTLREIISAGEQLYVTPAIRRFFAAHPGCVLENQYGPSETHVVTAHRLTGDPHDWPQRPPIGRPVPGARVYLVDERGDVAPIGVLGELWLAGDSVGDRYLGRPDLTAEKFSPDPFVGGRLYRSGDLGRFLPDGTIELSGRRDDQVKIRGYRVELGEIESALKALPGVADAAAAVKGGEKCLIGYFIPDASEPTAEQLREALRKSLPEYLVPAVLMPLRAFPLTPSGKLDRAALPERVAQTAMATSPPATPAEHRMAVLWQSVLDVPAVGTDQDFFVAGGDSLSAVRLLLAIRREWGVQINLDAVFAAPTIARLAALVDSRGEVASTVDLDAEAHLAPSITRGDAAHPVDPDPKAALVTGATGFLGAFVLRDLLETTGAIVHCVVRAGSASAAQGRVRAALSGYGIWREAYASRIEAVPGDLAAPRLGLSESTFEHLAATLDAIYHVGASVNLTRSYPLLRAANVGGTGEILRLAALRRNIPVHHVSTVGVFGGTSAMVGPRHPIGPAEALRNGYAQSKAVAEKVVEIGRSRGLPVSIYRPTRISGDTVNGRCQHHDYLWLLLKGCVQAGLAPLDFDAGFDLIPVDHVSAAIVALSRRTESIGANWHLSSGHLLRFTEATAQLASLGYPLRDVTMTQWVRAIEADPSNAAYPLLSLLTADAHRDSDTVFDAADTRAALSDVELPASLVDTNRFAAYVRSFVVDGFLPPAVSVRSGARASCA